MIYYIDERQVKYMVINEKLKARRLELGLTMAEVANIVGVSEATVSRWESGNIGNMKRDRIALYAKALQVSPAYIMGMDDMHALFNSAEERNGFSQADMSNKLLAIREHYKLTRSQFAKIAGTYADTVESWESGERIPTPDTIRTICQYFDIHPSEMLDSEHELNLAKSIPPESIRNITSQEAELLYYFDQLNEEGRAAILSTALAFTGMPQYKKCDTDDANLKNA